MVRDWRVNTHLRDHAMLEYLEEVIGQRDTLLEACELADGFLEKKGYPKDDPLVRGAIRNAIAKAKGEANA